VVLDLEGLTPFTARETKNPKRLTLRLHQTLAEPTLSDRILIRDGVVRRIGVDRSERWGLTVGIDFDEGVRQKVFTMKDPYRIVVDFHNPRVETKSTEPKKVKFAPEAGGTGSAGGSRFDVRTIVIDPGHGGKDPGAMGPGGTPEKAVTLSIAKKLQFELQKSLRCKVILTRNDDRYLDLAERTAIANVAGADLFISIHANASTNRHAHGTETYFLSPARSRAELETAARENMIAKASMDEIENDLAYILADMESTDNINQSVQLAGNVQRAIVRGTRSQHPRGKDLGVKQAMFYVLLEAKMPSILVETAFISNPAEEKRLTSPDYQWAVARSISVGVKSYVQETRLAYRTE
jgi:N-acetylmuramoyl-L-alanine amidase